MYRDYYKLGAEPFRLTPDPAFVYAHQSFRTAQARMLHALEQGDGILIVTGRPGTGKTMLIANFLSRLQPGKVLTATVGGTSLEGEGLLRMVGRAFGVDARNMDKAALLGELQDCLAQQPRALLVIDEAQNLTADALAEVHLLSNMHIGSRPLLQIFLVGQEQLHESLHTPETQQLHQRITGAGGLEPLSLQECHDFVLRRLQCAGWRGNPAIVSDVFILIHRFSQGLPRHICKLCTRLLAHGARHGRKSLNLDDVVTVIEGMQDEKLLPLQCESCPGSSAPLPLMQDLIESSELPMAERMQLTAEERAFLDANPRVVQTTPAALVRAAKQYGQSVITIDTGPETVVAAKNAHAGSDVAESNAPSPLGPAMARCRATGVQVLKSASHLLGALLTRAMSGMRHLVGRSRTLQPLAPALWRALRHQAARALYLPGYTVRVCRELLSKSLSGHGWRQMAAGCVSLMLVMLGTYLISVTLDNQQKRADATAALTQTATGEGAQAAAPDSSVNGEEPSLEGKFLPAVIASPAQDDPAQQVAGNEPGNAATAATSSHALPPDRSVAAVPEAAGQKALADAGGAEVSPVPSATAVRDERVEELLALAGQAMARDRLRTPENKNAWHYYSQVLVLDPDSRAAQDGMQQIAERYHQLAASVLRKQEFDKAEAFVQRGLSVVPDDRPLLDLQREVQTQRRDMYARQEALAAQRERELVSQASVASQPKSSGLFGTLKRFFKGNRNAGDPVQSTISNP